MPDWTNRHSRCYPRGVCRAFIPELNLVKLFVLTAVCQQFLVRSLFDDAAFRHDENPVGTAYGG